MSYLTDGLNEEQLKAVETTEGYIRVIAGAGSGKTRAFSHRFAYLVKELGIMPSNIMCVTFTNKVANEMKKRIRKLIGDNDCGYVSTFHGFCVSLLKEDPLLTSLEDEMLFFESVLQVAERMGIT